MEEDDSAFDPSGNSGNYADTEDNGASELEESSSNPSASHSGHTDDTSLSNGLRDLDLTKPTNGDLANLDSDKSDQLDHASKIAMLQEMFPTANEFNISYTLKKCNGSWDRALEELLNHAFFNDDSHNNQEGHISTKGIDAFSEDNGVRRSKKKRDRMRQRITNYVSEDDQSSSLSRPSTPSTWDQSRRDIEFIASRTHLSTQLVSSLYHRNSASMPATIVAILESSSGVNEGAVADEETVRAHALDLGKDFPSISPGHLTKMIRLTHPSTASAHELAKAMTATSRGARGGIEIIPRYAPINVSDDEDSTPRRLATRSDTAAFTPNSVHSSPDYRVIASNHHASAQHSFAQASAAYRRGKSDHLMGAAAGYYSQVGRDHASRRAEATAGAADALVASQSSRNELDLHGVSVKDAVRISRAKTEAWHKSANNRVMGLDGRMRNDDGAGGTFTIVTGLGRHSEGGRGKLGPAVGKMLVNEGWHVSFGEGILTVTGRRR